jgi:hypothetical protein
VLDGFDSSVINKRGQWMATATLSCGVVAALGFAAWWFVVRDLRRALADQAMLVAIGVLVSLGLVWVFGAPLGFPAPTPRMFYLPFFVAAATLCSAAVLGAVAAVAAVSMIFGPR